MVTLRVITLAAITVLLAGCGNPPPSVSDTFAEELGQPCGIVSGTQKYCKNARVTSYVAGVETFRQFSNRGESTHALAERLPVIYGIYKNSPEAWMTDGQGCVVVGPYLDLPGPGTITADFHLHAQTGNFGLPDPGTQMFSMDISGSNVPGDVRRSIKMSDMAPEVLIGNRWTYYLPGQVSPIPFDNGVNPQKSLHIFTLSTRVEAPVQKLEARVCDIHDSVAVVIGKIVVTYSRD